MHQSSYALMAQFARTVRDRYQDGAAVRILDVGSANIGGTYRDLFSFPGADYVGLDIQPGPNVDVVVRDAYDWKNIANESFDVIISGQALEHVEYPWLIFEQISAKLKIGGLGCVIAPSRGPEHKYPLDCYRYYPDGMKALAKWSGLTVLDCHYVQGPSGYGGGSDQWGDCRCIFTKPSPPDENIHASPKQSPLSTEHRHTRNPLRLVFPGYFDNERTEVVELICQLSLRARHVLELGCATGAFGRRLRERLHVERYIGVEGDMLAAQRARKVLTEVHGVDIERSGPEDVRAPEATIDLLVALDVLEHLYNPWDTLANYARAVVTGGHLVASIPNIANVSIIHGLARGEWRYAAAGLLDATHQRFFTLESMNELVTGAGFQITHVHRLLNPAPDMTQARHADNTIDLGNLRLSSLSKAELLNLFTQQFVLVAKKL